MHTPYAHVACGEIVVLVRVRVAKGAEVNQRLEAYGKTSTVVLACHYAVLRIQCAFMERPGPMPDIIEQQDPKCVGVTQQL